MLKNGDAIGYDMILQGNLKPRATFLQDLTRQVVGRDNISKDE